MITWGHNCQQGAYMILTGGPSVEVQFPHLKISTLTTVSKRTAITSLTFRGHVTFRDVNGHVTI